MGMSRNTKGVYCPDAGGTNASWRTEYVVVLSMWLCAISWMSVAFRGREETNLYKQGNTTLLFALWHADADCRLMEHVWAQFDTWFLNNIQCLWRTQQKSKIMLWKKHPYVLSSNQREDARDKTNEMPYGQQFIHHSSPTERHPINLHYIM